MSLFGKKKVFGLEQALKAEAIKPIPEDHASTTIAILESMEIPVTAGAEAEAKVAELKDSVKGMEEGIKSAKTELNVTPSLATLAINTLKAELKKLVEAIREVVLGKVDRIEDTRGEDIKILEHQIQVVKNKAETKSNKARTRGDKKAFKIENKIDKKIAEVEAQLKSDLANLRDQISDLEDGLELAKTEISTLEPIMKKWTFPKK